MPNGSVLVQYIDDLLVASTTKEACVEDTIALLNHLAEHGHKVAPTKMQFCLEEVTWAWSGHRQRWPLSRRAPCGTGPLGDIGCNTQTGIGLRDWDLLHEPHPISRGERGNERSHGPHTTKPRPGEKKMRPKGRG